MLVFYSEDECLDVLAEGPIEKKMAEDITRPPRMCEMASTSYPEPLYLVKA